MLERFTENFFLTGRSFNEFLENATEDEKGRYQKYYDRSEKKFSPEDYKIDLEHPINLLVVGTTWCWDSQTHIPIIVRIAENNPKINLRIFNKDQYPFLISKINGGEKVPQVLVLTQDFYYLDRWVERSTLAYQLVAELRKNIGWDKDKSKEFTKEFRKQFLKDQKKMEEAFIQEIRTLLIRTDAIQGTTTRLHKTDVSI
ncbi:MAG: thioredoxin family protein [Candidatus Hodarchaeota archaeon]